MSIFSCFFRTHVLHGFWSSIFQSQPDPFIAIFCVVRDELCLCHLHKNAVTYASFNAQRLILLNWKGKNPHSYVQWIKEVMLGLALEKNRYTVCSLEDKYDKTWSQFITRIKSLPFAWPPCLYLLFFSLWLSSWSSQCLECVYLFYLFILVFCYCLIHVFVGMPPRWGMGVHNFRKKNLNQWCHCFWYWKMIKLLKLRK